MVKTCFCGFFIFIKSMKFNAKSHEERESHNPSPQLMQASINAKPMFLPHPHVYIPFVSSSSIFIILHMLSFHCINWCSFSFLTIRFLENDLFKGIPFFLLSLQKYKYIWEEVLPFMLDTYKTLQAKNHLSWHLHFVV